MSKQPTDRKQKQREKRQEEEQQREQVEQQLMKERLKEQMDSNFCDTMGVIVKVSYGISALLVVWIVINMFFLKRNWPPAEQFPVYEYRNLIEKGDRLTLEGHGAAALVGQERRQRRARHQPLELLEAEVGPADRPELPAALDRHRPAGGQHDLGHVVAPEELDQLGQL